MNTNLQNNSEVPSEEEHILHMWEPLKFSVDRSYDYRRAGILGTTGNFLIRVFAQIILRPLNFLAFGFYVKGRENLKPLRGKGAVVVCNHVHPMDCTFIDIAVTGRRIYYTTLESNFKIPVIRHVIRGLGGVPLSSNPANMTQMFTEMEAALRSGCFAAMYPESVLHPYYNGLRRFKNGAFKLAADAGCAVLPAVVKFRPRRGIWKLLKHRRPCMSLQLLPPVIPDTACSDKNTQIEVLRDSVRAEMGAALN